LNKALQEPKNFKFEYPKKALIKGKLKRVNLGSQLTQLPKRITKFPKNPNWGS